MKPVWNMVLVAALAGGVLSASWVEKTRLSLGVVDTASKKAETLESLPALMNRSFWEVRRTLALMAWAEAQTYFHKGFDLTLFLPNRQAEEKAGQEMTEGKRLHSHDEQTSGELDIHSKEEERRIHSLENHPFVQQSALRPYVFKHGGVEGGTERMMPFYWLTTELDPSFVRAYANGAYWLAFHFKKPEEALRYLNLGMKRNPDDPTLYAMRGRIYFSLLKDSARAAADLEKAYALNPLGDDEQRDEALWALRYLGRAELQCKQYGNAIRAAYLGKRLDPSSIGFDTVISEATTALEGHPQ